MTIRAQFFDPATSDHATGSVELIDRWEGTPGAKIWIDFHRHDLAEERALLHNRFGIAPLTITDAQMTRRPPKIETFEKHTFILLKGLDAATKDIEFNTIQIALFIGERFFITRHAEVSLSTDKVWAMTENSERSLADGGDKLAVTLINTVVDRYLPVLLAVEERLDVLEDEITNNPRDDLLSELIVLKSNLTRMRRVMANHAHVFEEVAANPPVGIRPLLRGELRGVHEKLERARSLAELYYNLATDLREGYISLASHRLNNIMKVLTVVASIFIPLTFFAGIYGMNFEYMPELSFRYSYFILLGFMTVMGIGLVILFRKKNWL